MDDTLRTVGLADGEPSSQDRKETKVKIWTAWVEVEGSYELVASADADYYSGGYFALELERKFFDYDQEPRVLCLDVDDSLVAELFADDGDTDRSSRP